MSLGVCFFPAVVALEKNRKNSLGNSSDESVSSYRVFLRSYMRYTSYPSPLVEFCRFEEGRVCFVFRQSSMFYDVIKRTDGRDLEEASSDMA